ncbi:MAG: hypothetical protein U5K38_14295 [Woeseiaceae bacterium]|nr:hypothetical protein [Woeseiaceae bacterium]
MLTLFALAVISRWCWLRIPRRSTRSVALITQRVPDDITTVGEAIDFLLQGTGYQLQSTADPCQALLFAQPLPAAHRQLGPMTVRHALAVLAGPAYRPVVDTLYRRVTFELTEAATSNAEPSCNSE